MGVYTHCGIFWVLLLYESGENYHHFGGTCYILECLNDGKVTILFSCSLKLRCCTKDPTLNIRVQVFGYAIDPLTL
jgi:hypothetical protein